MKRREGPWDVHAERQGETEVRMTVCNPCQMPEHTLAHMYLKHAHQKG